jgi:pyrimidine operon attenuation protein/uracil phosphoribosyltransferase
MNEVKKNYILTAEKAMMKMRRMAYEILENNGTEQEIILAGVIGNGTVIASIMSSLLKEIAGFQVTQLLITLDKQQPKDVLIEPAINFNNKVVILIDDVINSGKTLTYALKPFLAANPAKIQTLVLVERTHTKFPVQANFVGLPLSTFLHEHIFVEVDGEQVLGAFVS